MLMPRLLADTQIIMQTQKLKEEMAQLTAEKKALEANIESFRDDMYNKQMQAASDSEKRMHDLERSHMSAAEALENMCGCLLLLLGHVSKIGQCCS